MEGRPRLLGEAAGSPVLQLAPTGTIPYTIRVNHTSQPPYGNRRLFNSFDILPNGAYQTYWLFVNLQLSLDR